jgi:hypothetical protein
VDTNSCGAAAGSCYGGERLNLAVCSGHQQL